MNKPDFCFILVSYCGKNGENVKQYNIADSTANIWRVLLKRILVVHAGGDHQVTYYWTLYILQSSCCISLVLSLCKIRDFRGLYLQFWGQEAVLELGTNVTKCFKRHFHSTEIRGTNGSCSVLSTDLKTWVMLFEFRQGYGCPFLPFSSTNAFLNASHFSSVFPLSTPEPFFTPRPFYSVHVGSFQEVKTGET